jgi:GNAT superfamily N-acetyltransferase
MQRVRAAVRENRLVSVTLTAEDYRRAIRAPGAGWVARVEGVLRGFAVGDSASGNVWALFVEPGHEGCGLGRALHDTLLAWLERHGPDTLWLTTEPDTRAERFYRTAGWRESGTTSSGELRFERLRRTPGARP